LQHLAVDSSDCLHDPFVAAVVNHVAQGAHTRAPCATWFTVCGRKLITGLTSAASQRSKISNTCKVIQKLGVSLPLLTCCTSAWPSRLLYRRGRKSRRDLWTTLYFLFICFHL
jgi:hypothetical protein